MPGDRRELLVTVTGSGKLIFQENTVPSYRVVKRSQRACESKAAKNDVAIFIVFTSFRCVMTTGIARPIPTEPTFRKYLTSGELHLPG